MDVERMLPSHLMRPEQSRWAEACDVARDHDDPRRCWDALLGAGLLPVDWSADPMRRYCEQIDEPRSAFPPSVALAVGLAADGERLLEVEVEARRAATTLEPWGGPRPVRLTFCAGAAPEGSKHRTLAHYVAGQLASRGSTDAQRQSLTEVETRIRRWFAEQPPESWGPPDYHADSVAGWDFDAQLKWEAAVRGRGTIDEGFVALQPRAVRKSLVGRKLAGLPSPFEPRICLWHLGYAISAITPEEILLSVVVGEHSWRSRSDPE